MFGRKFNVLRRGCSTLAIVLAVSISAGQVTAAEAEPVTFNIPAKSTAQALIDFSRQAGVQLLFPFDEAKKYWAPALNGTMGRDEALARLIQGTSLEVASATNTTISLKVKERSEANAGDAEEVPTEVVVTGSRIRGAAPAAPVTVLTAEDIRLGGQTDLGEAIRSLSQNYNGGQNPGVGFTQGALSNANGNSASKPNLRGLGADGTLTLLNGHRLPDDGSVAGVDISTIPLSAIAKLEVLADGSSALYGSDAVGGVINITLRRDFEGVALSGRVGQSTDGGNLQRQVSLVTGMTGETGGLMVAVDVSDVSRIKAEDRSYTASMNAENTLYPEIDRQNFVLAGHHEFTDTFGVKYDAVYSKRTSEMVSAAVKAQPVEFEGLRSWASAEMFSVAAQFDARYANGWRSSFLMQAGKDDSQQKSNQFYDNLLYPAALCYCNTAAVAEFNGEGPVFRLPGGMARLAVGAGLRESRMKYWREFNGSTLARFHAGMEGTSALSSGIEVSNQGLSGLIRNKSRSGAADATGGSEVLIVLREGKESRILLSASDDWLAETLKVSEGGDVSLLRRELRSTLGWDDDGRATGKPISSAVLTVWGATYGEPGLRRLIERPAGPGGAAVAWAPGGREVALTTLNLKGRAETVSTAYKAASAIQVIAPQCIPLAFQSRDDLVCRDVAEAVDVLWSRREGRWWSGAKAPVPTEPVWIDEAYDRAPVLKLREAGKAERVLWDLNPDFRPSIRVTEERFRLPGGAGEIKAGLYWPEGYRIGLRYPLVVQTHGWDRTTFQAEGLSSAGYAAMVLAKSGFFVVQLPDLPMQPRADEGRAYAAYFDAVIDQLIEQGKVDGARLGLQGWSRTGFAVRTALQTGKHRYSAAILADSMSGGYMSWLASENLSPAYQATVAELNGGSSAAAPSQWVLRSPPINSMMTQTPVLLQAYGPQSLLGVWEDYVILKRANVPVELRYFPEAMHYPRKPGERVAVLESAVAWYSRWLLDLPRAPPVRDKAAGN